MNVTLNDIAEKVGVSVSTVSRVVNGDVKKPASKETSDKVWEAIKELGYIPNQTAKKLKRQHIETPKAINCVYVCSDENTENPFLTEMVLGVKDAILKQGYTINLIISSNDEDFSQIYKDIINVPAAGTIIMGIFNESCLDYLKQHVSPLIYVGVNSIIKGIDEVICSGYMATQIATEYLVKHRHQKIAYLGKGVKEMNFKTEHRFKSFKDVLIKQKLETNTDWFIDTELTIEHGYINTKELLEQNNLPTAIFCSSDYIALGALRALSERGLNVPKDMSIISIGDIEYSAYSTPALTTVSIPIQQLGKHAVRLLFDKIEEPELDTVRVTIPFKLVERESVSTL